jgi:arylsulfatase
MMSIKTYFQYTSKTKAKQTILLVVTLVFSLFSCSKKQSTQQEQPNIILILADDLGYSDIGSYGGEIKTPTLDKLAQEGLRLSNMHNAGMCVISRSSMLTGQWWPQVGYGIEAGTNLAQALQKEGYRTGLVGKWHLNGAPNDKGFDYFFGFLGGYSTYFEGGKDYRLNQEKYDDFGADYYSTDAFSDRAIEFINTKEGEDKTPFFLYLSYQAPHNPLQAPKEDILPYRGTYLKGWQAVRDARIEKQKSLGVIQATTPLPQYPMNLPAWGTLSAAQKDLEDLRMSVYAAMVERMDKGIGRLIQALQASGQDKNTLILFLSDNGTDSFSVLDAVMVKKGLLPGDIGSNYQPGTGWAYASVAPKRLYKISQHGGGVKTGAIAWWPQGIQKKGALLSQPLHVVDIMPTLLEIARTSKPQVDPLQADSLAGGSFLPLLKDKKWSRKSPLYFQFMDNRAIRTDQWSLVEVDGNGWELYDNQTDPLETNDLAQAYPNQVIQLEKDWLDWWISQSGNSSYEPESTSDNMHYTPQGDRGSGGIYVPTAMPEQLRNKY